MNNKSEIDIKLLDDDSLWEKFTSTNNEKFIAELFERYNKICFGYALKITKNEVMAEDIVMDIFEKLITKKNDYNIKMISSYIYKMTKNESLIKIKPKLKTEVIEDGKIDYFIQEISDENIINEELYIKLEKNIKNLKSEQMECIKMFYLEKMTYKEIENNTNYTLKEIKTFIQNGRRNLKNNLNLL